MMTSLDLDRLRITKKRLKLWANWCRQTMTMGLYFSSQSIILQIDEISCTAKRLASNNTEAEEVEEAILRLSKISPQQAKTLYIHYVKEGSDVDKIKKLGFPSSTYYNLLKRAEYWIAENIFE